VFPKLIKISDFLSIAVTSASQPAAILLIQDKSWWPRKALIPGKLPVQGGMDAQLQECNAGKHQ